MNTTHTYGSDLVSLTGNCISLHALYLMMNRSLTDPADLTGLLIWLAGLIGVYLLLIFFLHIADRPQMTPVVYGIALLLQVMAIRRFGQPPASLLGWLCLLFLWGIPWFRANDFFYHPETSEQRMLDLEITVILFLILAVFTSAGTLPMTVLLPVTASLALQLLSLAFRRTAGSSGSGHPAAALLTVLLPFGLTIAAVALLSPLQHILTLGSQSAVRSARAFLGFVGSRIDRFLLWLFSFFSVESQPIEWMEAETSASSEVSTAGLLSVDAVMTPLLLVFIVCGAAALLLMSRTALPTSAGSRGRTRRQFSLLARICDCVYRLRRRIHFLATYLRHRGTAAGLYCQIEFRMASRKEARQIHETPRAFLMRAAVCYPGCEDDLRLLADRLEQYYFSTSRNVENREELERIRAHLKTSLQNRNA